MQLCLLVDGGGKCNMKCGSSCVSCCQWQCRKLNIVAMGNATRTVEGVVDACCVSRCICCCQCRLFLLAEKSLVNRSCRNRGNKNCGSCCAAVLGG